MSQTTERIHELVDKLNQYRDEYYNRNAPSVSDAVYDHLYDELERNALKRIREGIGDHPEQFPHPDRGLQSRQQSGKGAAPYPTALTGQDQDGERVGDFPEETRSPAHAEAGRSDRKARL